MWVHQGSGAGLKFEDLADGMDTRQDRRGRTTAHKFGVYALKFSV